MSSMRVLAVDPGLTRCGVGIVDANGNTKLSLIDFAIIQTNSDLPLEQRLLELEQNLQKLIEKFEPNVIAVERVFSQLNVRTAMSTAQAGGVALLLAAKSKIPVVLHTPSEVKAAVTGSGRADKKQVANMVKKILKLEQIPKPVDVTDALALAICHHWRGSAQTRLTAAIIKNSKRTKVKKRQ